MPELHSLPTDLRLAVGRIARRLRQLYAEPSGEPAISFLELAVLSSLERKGPSSPGRLADGERVTAPAVAAALRSLERVGSVVRRADASDGRRVVVALTPAGQRILGNRDRTVTSRLASVLEANFTDRERRRLAESIPLLERLADVL